MAIVVIVPSHGGTSAVGGSDPNHAFTWAKGICTVSSIGRASDS